MDLSENPRTAATKGPVATLLASALLFALHMGAYYAALDDGYDIRGLPTGEARGEARYWSDDIAPLAGEIFRPAHELDRLLRPHRWPFYSVDDVGEWFCS